MLLIVGGQWDPNIQLLVERLNIRNITHIALLVGRDLHPSISWDMHQDTLLLNGERISPDACFIRYDVFAGLAENRTAPSNRALQWYTALTGWLLAHPPVSMFNRHSITRLPNKPYVLHLAHELGLATPKTLISNDIGLVSQLNTSTTLIAKPVMDGGYCEKLDDIIPRCNTQQNSAAGPAIVQTCLVPPEVRVYYISGQLIAFEIVSNQLDYRVNDNIEILMYKHLSQKICKGLRRLATELEMNFGAADFKMCPLTGELQFLEFNSAPMFAAFDIHAQGKLVDALIDDLTQNDTQ